MHVFNAKVRLAGELNNEVYKRGLTVPEILVMEKLHGKGSVVILEHAGSLSDYDDDEERERLTELYDGGLQALHEDEKTSIKKMFSEYGPLPLKLKTFDGDLSDKEFEEIELAQASEPFQSPNSLSVADERKQRRDNRRKAKVTVDAKAAAQTAKPAARITPPAAATKKSSAGSIEAVL